MSKLMRRRRALMAQSASAPANGLVNGSYASNTVTISNNKHWVINAPVSLTYVKVPLINSISVKNGDVLTGRFSAPATSNGVNSYWFFLVDNNRKRFNTNTQRPAADKDYSVTLDSDGVLSEVILQPRAAGMAGEFDFTLKINGEVIF